VTVELATWNVERLTPSQAGRASRVGHVIDQVNADIWVLTETHADIRPGPDYNGVHTGEPDRPGLPGERWASIWSRFPLEPLTDTSDSSRTTAAIVETPNGPIIIFACVLPWVGSAWGGTRWSNGAFSASLQSQATDWARIANGRPSAPLFVLGDLNQDLSATHYYGSRANQSELRRRLAASGLSAATGGGSDPVRRHATDRAAIDHICGPTAVLSRSSALVEAWPAAPAPDRGLSDHYGLALTIDDRAA
jgi:endonuclease/exonuclease/phosphatase family metal-dependent hydrolase